MASNLSSVLQQLRGERERAARELERLDRAIEALGDVSRSGAGRGRGRGQRRRFSAATRHRMALAQRARWAKLKAKQGKKRV